MGVVLTPICSPIPWRANLTAFAYATRAALKRHAWLLPLLTSRPTLGPNYLRWFEYALSVISALNPDMTIMMQMYSALYAYITGVVGYELAEEENTRRTGLTDEDKHRYATPYVQQVVAGGQHPYFARFFAEATTTGMDQNFAFGLDCLLDGLGGTQRTQTHRLAGPP